MRVMVVDGMGKPVSWEYVIRIPGWSLERYIEDAPEDLLCEFVRGEAIMYSPASAEHQDLVGFLILPEEIPKARGVILNVRPVLIVEVMSLSTRSIDLGEKVKDYAEAFV